MPHTPLSPLSYCTDVKNLHLNCEPVILPSCLWLFLPLRYGLFVQAATEEGLLYPHPAAAFLGHGLPMIEFLGRIVGKALYEGILLEYSFAPLFVSQLVGRYAFLDSLSSLDAELYKNLMYLKVGG